jgi:fructose-1,6-bisphosphatase/inositol monophosphatase family enzyme
MLLAEFDRHCISIARTAARFVFSDAAQATVGSKTGYDGAAGSDVVTSTGLRAQRLIEQKVRQHLPGRLGLIGEEQGLRRPSTFKGFKAILTIDPDDGSRALERALRQRRSLTRGEVSVMLGLLVDGHPVAGYICDVATTNTYIRRPYGSQVLRISPDGTTTDMATLPGAASLVKGTLLYHGNRPEGSPLTRQLLDRTFGQIVWGSDSIGLSVMRAFEGEFVGVLRVAGKYTTPWDDTPLAAMCWLGHVLSLRVYDDRLEEVRVGPLDRITPRDYDMLYVHRRYARELSKIAPVRTLVAQTAGR